MMPFPIEHTDEEWRRILEPDRYRVLRRGGTEPPFGNEYWDEHRDGVYRCGGCSTVLFDAGDKFDSGTGWPSFARPVSDGVIEERVDDTLGTVRTEALCATCGGHLGHIFDDGPPTTGLRYCMNSLSLAFEPREE